MDNSRQDCSLLHSPDLEEIFDIDAYYEADQLLPFGAPDSELPSLPDTGSSNQMTTGPESRPEQEQASDTIASQQFTANLLETFDLAPHYGESAPDTEQQMSSGALCPDPAARFEPCAEQEHPSTTRAASPEDQAASTNRVVGSLIEPTQIAELRTNSFLPQEQLSRSDDSHDEVLGIDYELEAIELQLRRNRLQKERQKLIQNSPHLRQEHSSEHFRPQDNHNAIASTHGVVAVTSQGGITSNTNQNMMILVSKAPEID